MIQFVTFETCFRYENPVYTLKKAAWPDRLGLFCEEMGNSEKHDLIIAFQLPHDGVEHDVEVDNIIWNHGIDYYYKEWA